MVTAPTTVRGVPANMGAQSRPSWRESGVAYLYLAPAIVLLTAFNFFPAAFAFYISLFKWGLVQEEFVGLQNYVRLLTNEDFWASLGISVWYVILAIPAEMGLGLLIAYLLFQPLRGRGAYRTAYFLPYITSTVAAGLVWRWLYNSEYGLFNGLLELAGLRGLNWLGDQALAMPAVILMSVWRDSCEATPDRPESSC